ncbi:conserved hypothetical protein [Talaromyces stipitatus ATCC 10500]|uniref:Uncharacterized protein n=1 Tax=Talaromyces stipitatus (strain ATCC 10500 / CBS 375.48 / QM 6759 / NRRL 1006) TaxID=441959 RepID=B8MG14_TALSN|nr:uncharacterized protein TSTA_009990 [Talaromyces stipitatus ATCC 10500]EED15881.1 conserved hypothetical protein [Talaromyces stipitatus ATCC 10500]
MRFTVSQAFLVSLLASSQFVLGFQSDVEAREVDKKHVGSPSTFASRWVQLSAPVEARHHTESQIAAKEAAAKKKGKKPKREASPQEADEFGPWDSTEDEFGSWVDKRDPHHTEAQIAAKEAAAKKKGKKPKREASPEAADEDDSEVEKREAHHTEAQIAAKKAAAGKKNGKKPKREASPQEPDEFGPWDSTEDEFGSWVDKRDPHHTEAQIAAKKAAAAKKNGKNPKREASPEETEEESEIEKREAHHTEAQIAAKKAAAGKKNGKKPRREASPQEADEFGPWDSTEDEFGSWVDKREAHHTEAQIAAKKAAAKKKGTNA